MIPRRAPLPSLEQREGLLLGELSAEPDTLALYFGPLAMVRNEQRRGHEIVPVPEQAAAHNPAVPAYETCLAAGALLTRADDDVQPLPASRALGGFASIPRDQVYPSALAMWAAVAAELGASRECALFAPRKDRVIWTGAMDYGSARSYLGMLAAMVGSIERAREHFATASQLHEKESINKWGARNLCACARALLARGERDEAFVTADKALALASNRCYELSAWRAFEVLRLAASLGPWVTVAT